MPREIKAREVLHGGRMRWRVIVPAKLNSGKFGRRYFTGKDAKKRAEKYAADLEKIRTKAAGRLLGQPEDVQVVLMAAVDTMGPERIRELPDAVRVHMSTKAALSVPVPQAVGECLQEKAKGNLSPRYMRGIRSTLERFTLGKESTPIDEITVAQIEDFINRLQASASRRSQLIDLRSLFSFALRRGYVRANTALLVAIPQRDELEPGILTVPQVRHVLYWVQKQAPEIMRFVALVLFGGVRPDEAKLLTEAAVKGNLIDVPASVSKTGRRRLIETNDTFKAFWELGGELPLPEWKARKVREFVRPWPHDALRHSFVTYHHALYGEVATSAAAGHSIAVMHKHYRALVSKTDSENFWAIRPI